MIDDAATTIMPVEDRSPGEKAFFAALAALVALISLYPETIIHQQVIILSITVTPLVVLIPLVFLTFAWFAAEQVKIFRPKLFDAIFLVTMIYILIRAILAAEALIEYRLAVEYVGFAIAAYYGAALLMRRESNQIFMIRIIALLLLAVSAYEVFTFIIKSDPIYGSALASYVGVENPDFYRGGSMLGQPVLLGGYLVITLPFAFLGSILENNRKWRIVFIVTFVLAAISILLSFSRGAMFTALLVAIATYLLGGFTLRKEAAIGIAVIMIFILSFLAISGDLQFQLFGRSGSFWIRNSMWRGAVSVIRDHPIFGVGLFKSMSAVNELNGEISKGSFPVDNSYLAIVVEQGFAGALLYGIALVSVIVGGVHTFMRSSPEKKLLPLFLTASVAAIAINAVLFDAFIIWPHFILFWVVAGFLRALADSYSAEEAITPRKSP